MNEPSVFNGPEAVQGLRTICLESTKCSTGSKGWGFTALGSRVGSIMGVSLNRRTLIKTPKIF